MDDYADGPEATELYLRHLAPRISTLGQVLGVASLRTFLQEEDGDWTARGARGWSEARRSRLMRACDELINQPRWKELTVRTLDTNQDPGSSYQAIAAARLLGIDAWPFHLARARAGGEPNWFELMRTDDAARAEEVVRLAEQRLPLELIGSGAGLELGLGKEFAAHGQLDFVLQDLDRFPGTGWKLISAGLQSPVIRNRNMAVRAFSSWDRAHWPEGAEAALQAAVFKEPDDSVRKRLKAVLAGKPLPE